MRLSLTEGLTETQRTVITTVGQAAGQLQQPAYLVGGPVRDLLLKRPFYDLDIAVEGEIGGLLAIIAEQLEATWVAHDRFGTATVVIGSKLHVDLAQTRCERYPYPGSLPVVQPASLADDLHRRDFTVNALALRIDRDPGRLYDPLGAMTDLEAGVLRVLHSQSFRDDPTRIIRAARYAARFQFQVDDATAQQALQAVQAGALATISGRRLWNDFSRLLEESDRTAALQMLDEWGVLAHLGLSLPEDLQVLQHLDAGFHRLALHEAPATIALAALAILAGTNVQQPIEILALAGRRARSLADAARAVQHGVAFSEPAKKSTLYTLFSALSEAAWLALWASVPESRKNLETALQLRDVKPDINGNDLAACGYCPGPAFALALEAALEAKLDEGADRDGQLTRAMQLLQQAKCNH